MIRSLSSFLLLSLFVISSSAQEKSLTAETKIQRVIVFLNGAQIERSSNVAIPAGVSLILFKGLSPQIEEKSIQVKGIGAFTILSVNKQSNFLEEQRASERKQNLRDRIADLTDKREIQLNVINILKKEEDMLASNQNIGNGGAGLDLNKLRQALDFQKARLTENKVKQLNTQKEIKKRSDEIQKVQNQLKEEAGNVRSSTSDIAVKISSKAALNGSFNLSYLVKSAGWYPTYDLRATDVNKPMNLIYRANVSQQSGEDWKDVKLVLSSGDPSVAAAKPTLIPYQIGYNVSYYKPSAAIGNVSGRVTDESGEALPGASIKIKGTSIGTVSNESGYYSIQVPGQNSVLMFSYIGFKTIEQAIIGSEMNITMKSDNALNEVVVVGYGSTAGSDIEGRSDGVRIRGMSSIKKSSIPLEVHSQQNQTNVQFEIERPYTIANDGKQLTVEIAEHQLNADYRYHAIPKLSEFAYLTASVAGINELNLLSGEASVFFDGAYLGKTLINIENTNDTMSVSLGADKNVLVKRTPQKEQNERSFVGANQRSTRAFNLEVLSRKTQPIQITVEDQIPVSTSSDVSVESLELSGAKLNEDTGILKWEFQLQPQGKKSLKLKYQVKYPKNRPLNLE